MPLTADQKATLKKILASHQRNLRAIVKEHQKTLVQAVTDLDTKKAEAIRKSIG